MGDTTYLGSDVDDEEPGYLQARKYKIKARCDRCGKVFSWIASTPGGPDKPCPAPACIAANMEVEIEKRAFRLAKMLDEQRAPGVIGQSNIVRAIDATADIVMKDHGLTDLKDNVRQGDILAPNLKGKGVNGMALQSAADGFFTPGIPKGTNRAVAARMNRRVRNVMAGGGIRVHPSVMAPGVEAGTPAIAHVKTEANSGYAGKG